VRSAIPSARQTHRISRQSVHPKCALRHARGFLFFSLRDLSDPLWRFKNAKDAREREKKKRVSAQQKDRTLLFLARKVTRGRAMAADVDKEAANMFVFLLLL